MTRDEIVDLLEILFGAYPNQKIKDAERMIQAWQLAFADEEAERIYKAARFHINRNKFFPTVADIRESIEKGVLIYSNQVQEAPAIESSKPLEDDEWLCDQYCEDCEDYKSPTGCPFSLIAHGGSKPKGLQKLG